MSLVHNEDTTQAEKTTPTVLVASDIMSKQYREKKTENEPKHGNRQAQSENSNRKRKERKRGKKGNL